MTTWCWRTQVRGLLVADWRRWSAEWIQEPLGYVWEAGNVTKDEALDWRDEAWAAAEGEEEKEGDEHVEGSDANRRGAQ